MFLKFGNDAIEPQRMKTAMLYKTYTIYNVEFSDIVVAGKQLHIEKTILNHDSYMYC